MLRHILRRLYRDRRRYLICWALLFAAGFITFWGVQHNHFRSMMPLAGGLAFMVGIGLFIPLLCLLIPPWRFVCEVLAALLLAQAVLGRFYPDISILALEGRTTLWFFAAAFLLAQLYTGTFLDKYLSMNGFSRTSWARSRLTPDQLYDGLLGRPERPEALAYSDDLISLTQAEDDPNHLVFKIQAHPIGSTTEHHFITLDQPPYARRYDWTMDDLPKDAPFTHGSHDYEIADRGTYRRVTQVSMMDRYPTRAALMTWVDDSMGRILDGWISELERRARKDLRPVDALPAE